MTAKAPNPLPGLYSQAIVVGGFVFCPGMVAMVPETSAIVEGDIQVHTNQCIKNLAAALEAAGSTLDNVTIFMSNYEDFARMNEVFMSYWGDVKPCRTCVTVKKLALNNDVEAGCTAV